MRPVGLGWWLQGLVLLAAGCSHDAPRDNPLDPHLTPPVEVQVALDDSAGTATVTWTRYEGQEPFAAYWVLRNAARSTQVDTLQEVLEANQTAYVDTSLAPNTAYSYRVSVINSSGHEGASHEAQTRPMAQGTIRLLPVEAEAVEGALVLRWTRYVGPGFGAYQVRRGVAEVALDSVVAEVSDVRDTMLVDTTARADVSYAYRVVVEGLGEEVESNLQVARLWLPAVQIVRADFSSATAMATVTWTPYAGPRFQAYELRRRTENQTERAVATITDVTATSHVDGELHGNTRYHYRVAVLTDRTEEIVGEEISGGFHELVATWPLEVGEGEYVRLYAEPDGGIAVLTSHPEEVRLLLLDDQGGVRGQQQYPVVGVEPRSVAAALNSAGRYLTLKGASGRGVLRLEADGRPAWEERALFADVFADPLGVDERRMRGEFQLVAGPVGTAFFDRASVLSQGGLIFLDDFEPDSPAAWDWTSPYATLHGGRLTRANLQNKTPMARVADDAWVDLGMEAELATSGGAAGLVVGGTVMQGSWFHLEVDDLAQVAMLTWTHRDVGEGVFVAEEYEQPLLVVGGTVIRLHLEVVSGRVRAWVASPAVWQAQGEAAGGEGWGTLAAVADKLLVTGGDRRATVNTDGSRVAADTLASHISELRVWNPTQGKYPVIGICLPWDNHVRLATTAITFLGEIVWPSFSTVVGSGFGPAPGELLAPLSFDFGPDRRIYVLDAGNSRIQVFDPAGKYITQWGAKGSLDGEFDFGSGWTARDLAGSLAVGADGKVYVADMLNGRIQVFGP